MLYMHTYTRYILYMNAYTTYILYFALMIVFKLHLQLISVIHSCTDGFYIVKNAHSRNRNQKSHFTMFLFPHWLVTSPVSLSSRDENWFLGSCCY